MARVAILGAPYQGRDLIASGQECINLYAELNTGDPQSPVPITHYLTPGLLNYVNPDFNKPVRGIYRTTAGTVIFVVGQNVYFLADNQTISLIGFISDRPSQVYMADNGLAVVIVDGVGGYAIDMASNAFGQIIDPNFYGADFVVFLDTFFCFNRPNTNQFYISLSMVDYTLLTSGTAFDPLDIAAKSGSADNIVGIAISHQELWLIGSLTTEVWIGTGAADFFFQQVQGAYIDHGCAAPYSISGQDVATFWIMQDRQGQAIVVQGNNYQVKEISTPRIVKIIKDLGTFSDAIGFSFQQQGHAFYAVAFPTGNLTLLYNLKTEFWSKWAWTDENGNLNRHRANCAAFAYGENLVGDWENGKIYSLDPNTATDIDGPITRIRTYPHMIQDGKKVTYREFVVDITCGTSTANPPDDEPTITLSWSDDRGKTFGNGVMQSIGYQGKYLTQPSWNRLGMARDRVFKVQWSTPAITALNGGFVDAIPATA